MIFTKYDHRKFQMIPANSHMLHLVDVYGVAAQSQK